MDKQKRRKRNAEKARRLETLRQRADLRYMTTRATMTMYGNGGQVEYLAVAVHKGSQLIEARFFDACDYQNAEQMCQDAVAFACSLGVEQVQMVEGVLEPECGPDGQRHCRIADKEPQAVN